MDEDAARVVAERLWTSASTGIPCDAPSALATLTVDDAYHVARSAIERRRADGSRVAGLKAALTSSQTRAAVGSAEPVLGVLFDDDLIDDGASVSIGRFIQPAVEVEIAVLLGEHIPAGPLTAADIAAHAAGVAVAIEVIDSRVADWRYEAVTDLVADNAAAAACVVAAARHDPACLEHVTTGRTLVNGVEVRHGRWCDNDAPLDVAAWLASAAQERGVPLGPGAVLLTGTFGPPVPVTRGDLVEGEIVGFGAVAVRFR